MENAMSHFQLTTLRVDGRALAGNPLGDPHVRDLPLIAPTAHDGARPLPLLFLLSGYSGVGRMLLREDDPWEEGLLQRTNRLAAAGKLGPMLIALPDCFTRYGGSQYINSAATGRYEDHLWQDLLPSVRARFPVGRVGVSGKSSGGYGAIVQAMRHPEVLSAVAVHSGDMYFEYGYLVDFPKVARTLRRHGGLDSFLAHFAGVAKRRDGKLIETMNILAMASCYSPDEKSARGFALPFDIETGAIDEAVWSRWLRHDPIRMLDEKSHADALRGMRLLHVECGTRDEFFLDHGARIFTRKLRALSIPHRHEEFDDTHMGLSYRYDVTLPLLYDALKD
jgi:enterochelin esterase family protein